MELFLAPVLAVEGSAALLEQGLLGSDISIAVVSESDRRTGHYRCDVLADLLHDALGVCGAPRRR